jgi:hypothetical protein
MTNRISNVANRLVASNQTTFIKMRYILESVVIAHEVIHSVHQSKQEGFILKVDYEKAYDKVNWKFLLGILEKRGFGKRWVPGLPEWVGLSDTSSSLQRPLVPPEFTEICPVS